MENQFTYNEKENWIRTMLVTKDEKYIYIGCDDGKIYKAEFHPGADLIPFNAHYYGVINKLLF